MGGAVTALVRRVNGRGALGAAERIGRPLDDERFIDRAERLIDRSLRVGERGSRPKRLNVLDCTLSARHENQGQAPLGISPSLLILAAIARS